MSFVCNFIASYHHLIALFCGIRKPTNDHFKCILNFYAQISKLIFKSSFLIKLMKLTILRLAGNHSPFLPFCGKLFKLL